MRQGFGALELAPAGGKQIQLAVIRRLASDQKHLIGSMFVNPGGPGESGVELVRDKGSDFNVAGGGRFNIVSWDPRGTNRSDPVRCFTSQASEARFWRGVHIPTTAAQSRAYARRATELARRCGQVSGQLLDNISTEDTARDLNRLRQLVGDRALTYFGLSYGTLIGQIYANLFPTRVRAMLLNSVVNAVPWVKNAEARTTYQASSADAVFTQFVALCQGAGPARCALTRHPETAAQRVAGLFRRARRAPIPAPHASPPGVLSYSDLLLTTFEPLRSPDDWPRYARALDAAAGGDGSALETLARQMLTPFAFAKATTSTAIQCLDARPTSLSTPGPGSSRTSTARASCGDRTKPGRNGLPARRTGRGTPPSATPVRGTPRPRPRSCSSTTCMTRPPATPAPSALNAGWATRCCSPWPATATRLSCPARVPTNGESATSSISSPRHRARSAEPSDRSGDTRHRCRGSERFGHHVVRLLVRR